MGSAKVTDIFADVAVILVVVMALEALHVEMKPLELQFSWSMVEVGWEMQVFGIWDKNRIM